MADKSLAKLVQLMTAPTDAELHRAAILVSGAIASNKDREVVAALVGELKNSDVDLRTAAITALGRLEVDEALPQFVEFVRQNGPEMEVAAQAASSLGAKGARAMGKLMEDATPSLRSRIAAVLAKAGGASAVVVTAHALVDPDPKVVESAARSLAMEIPSYTSAQRHALAKFIHESLQDKKAKHPPRTEGALVRVLGGLHEAKSDDVFWARILPPTSVEVRAAALQALGNLGAKVADARLPKLLACAVDKDFQVVASALMLLKQVPVNAKTASHWVKLLEAPDVASRRFAVVRLHGVATKEVARGLVAQASHPDRGLREDSLGALRTFAAGRQAMLDKLLETQGQDEVWTLARALAPAAKELTPAQRSELFAQACKFHDDDDRRASPLLFLLRESNLAWTRTQLTTKAQALRQKKKYAEALGYLRILAQDPACSDETRFELAATGLKLSSRDPAIEARSNDPALAEFMRLLQNAEFDTTGHVAKAKWLEPEELFFLGFHFVEQSHRAKEFGKDVLELLVRRSPTSEIGKQAKRKLKSAGLV